MKGIIFNVAEKAVTELLGAEAWEDLLEDAGVNGDYTALGTYPDEELIALVVAAAEKTGHDAAEVQRDQMAVGDQVVGPAAVVEEETTIIVPTSRSAIRQPDGCIDIMVKG